MPMSELPGAPGDLRLLVSRPLALLVTVFRGRRDRHGGVLPVMQAAAAQAAQPAPALLGSALGVQRWWDMQERVAVPYSNVAPCWSKFNDYQCPSCKSSTFEPSSPV